MPPSLGNSFGSIEKIKPLPLDLITLLLLVHHTDAVREYAYIIATHLSAVSTQLSTRRTSKAGLSSA
jgi:hypothetical protein